MYNSTKTPYGFTKGKAKPLSHCCQDIRLCCTGVVGDITNGWNEETQKQDTVMVIKGIKENEVGKAYKPAEVIVIELNKISVWVKN